MAEPEAARAPTPGLRSEATKEAGPHEPKGAPPPGLRSDEGATREGGGSRAPGGERGINRAPGGERGKHSKQSTHHGPFRKKEKILGNRTDVCAVC
jgi:hypothetical protein